MDSERIVVQSPMSYLGSAKRLWNVTRSDSAAARWLLLIPSAAALVALAWMAVTGWYLAFGLLVVPYRLVRRGQRKRNLDDARHRERAQASQSP